MAQVNEQIRINATFYFDEDISDNIPSTVTTPTSVLFEVLVDDVVLYSDPAVENGDVWYHSYTPLTEDEYTFRFTASFEDADDLAVEQAVTVGPETATPNYLSSDIEIIFGAFLSPMYVDPEELVGFFPTLNEFEIAEAIHVASLKVKALFDLEDDEEPPAYAVDFVHAAAACALSRIVNDLFGSGSYSKDDFTLGDLTIKDSSGSSAKSKVNPGNASTWCELAFVLETEMKMKSVSSKAFVKGTYYPNPVPERRLPARHGGRGVIRDTGRIDD